MAQLGLIHPGDIVEVDKKGRIFYAKVQQAATDGVLPILPLDSRITYRMATAKEIVAQYRRTKNVRQVRVPVDMTPESV